MVNPFIPIALADLVLSGLSYGNYAYQQSNNNKLWKQNLDVQKRLYDGEVAYLRKLGLSVNPDKAWSRYISGMASLQNNMDNSSLSLSNYGLGLAKHSMYQVGNLYRLW